MKSKESQNEKLMNEFVYEKKKHNEQIIATTKKALIKDQFVPSEMTLSIVRQQKLVQATELKNKILCDELSQF